MLNPVLVAEAMKSAQETERLSSAALPNCNCASRANLVRFAAECSPFYRRLYQPLDVERAVPADLPTVTKEQIQQHFDEVVTDPRLNWHDVKDFCESPPPNRPWHLDAFAVLWTSGTTGVRGCYVWDAPALAAAVAAGYRQSNRGGGGPRRLAAVVQTDAADATNVLLSQLPPSAAVVRRVDIRQDFDSVCRELNEFKPMMLASYPYMLWLLAEAQKSGRLAIRPRRSHQLRGCPDPATAPPSRPLSRRRCSTIIAQQRFHISLGSARPTTACTSTPIACFWSPWTHTTGPCRRGRWATRSWSRT